MDLINIFPNCVFLYGGSYNIKEEVNPFKIVLERILDTIKVINIPRKITSITVSVDNIEEKNPLYVPAIKIVAIDIRKGNLPITRN